MKQTQMPHWRNRIGAEREARGLTREQMAARCAIDPRRYLEIEAGRLLPRFEEFQRIRANLDDIDPVRLHTVAMIIGLRSMKKDNADFRFFYEEMASSSHLLVAPDEVLWLDHVSAPGRDVDVFFNMSCSTQFVPHLMLDSAAALQALGVSFVSGSGPKYCCGTYFGLSDDKFDRADRMNASNVARAISWGADTAVHLCTQCVNMYASRAQRHELETGEPQGVRHVQLLRFVDELLAELGDSIPWKQEVHAKVLVHGHEALHVHEMAKRDVAKVAARIPGVEVVGVLDRTFVDDFCMPSFASKQERTSESGVTIGGSYLPRPKDRAEVERYRVELAGIADSWGADTISPQHQTCLQMWEPFSSERVRVRHVMSLLAEALGVGHPDRYLAASRLGDVRAVVEQTRPIWSAWGMSEEEARERARRLFDPAYQTVGACGCGRGPGERCGHSGPQLVTIDVRKGAV